jgi:hypothetical protein
MKKAILQRLEQNSTRFPPGYPGTFPELEAKGRRKAIPLAQDKE